MTAMATLRNSVRRSLTTLGYDVANRVATVNSTSAYAYDSSNQRVYYRNSAGTETIYVYGTGGKLATYTIAGTTGSQVNFAWQSQNVYFAGKLLSAEGNAVAVDRLGSVRWSAEGGATRHRYYPYGVEYNPDTNDTEKYATYTRDSLTGLDYAMNRYYYSAWGRFMMPDRNSRSARVGSPQSWNRYAYALSDPVNRNDPSGLCDDCKDDDGCPSNTVCSFGGGDSGGDVGGGGDGSDNSCTGEGCGDG